MIDYMEVELAHENRGLFALMLHDVEWERTRHLHGLSIDPNTLFDAWDRLCKEFQTLSKSKEKAITDAVAEMQEELESVRADLKRSEEYCHDLEHRLAHPRKRGNQ